MRGTLRMAASRCSAERTSIGEGAGLPPPAERVVEGRPADLSWGTEDGHGGRCWLRGGLKETEERKEWAEC